MIRLAVRVAAPDAEVALAELLVLSPRGLEEVDHADGSVEYVLYGMAGELPSLPAIEAGVGRPLICVDRSEIADDWLERWREFHRPVGIGGRLWVRPPWSPPAASGWIDLAIEPAQAFGTGAHPTTRMSLGLLVALERAGDASGALLDVGCGSGVLAIAAAKLGWGPVVAVDHDGASVAATLENARANTAAVDALLLDLRRDALPSASTLTANLLEPLLLELCPRLADAPPARLIASGLLVAQADGIVCAYAEQLGLRERERRVEGEWAALLLER